MGCLHCEDMCMCVCAHLRNKMYNQFCKEIQRSQLQDTLFETLVEVLQKSAIITGVIIQTYFKGVTKQLPTSSVCF